MMTTVLALALVAVAFGYRYCHIIERRRVLSQMAHRRQYPVSPYPTFPEDAERRRHEAIMLVTMGRTR